MWKMFAHIHSPLIDDMAWGKDSYRKFTLEVPLFSDLAPRFTPITLLYHLPCKAREMVRQ